MSKDFIPQMRPDFGIEERLELSKYLESDVFLTEYKKTEELESIIAEFTGAKHAILVNNGTVSLTLAALALGIKAGDEVIVPNYTMIATPNSIKLIGANPVFVDVEPETLILDLKKVEAAITNRTKAIILVLANGREPSVGVKDFLALSNKYNIPIIEDAAQALGSYYRDGAHIGLKGKIGSFSFSTPKIISTGQGGALVTNDDVIAQDIRRLKDFGRNSGGIDIHDVIGFNFKFTDLQACIGIAQFKKLPYRIRRKREIAQRFSDNLMEVDPVRLFHHDLSICTPWFIDSKVESRAELVDFLYSKSIGTRLMYPPINEQKAYGEQGFFPNSKDIGDRGLWLPSFITITNDQIDYVCDCIKLFYGVGQ